MDQTETAQESWNTDKTEILKSHKFKCLCALSRKAAPKPLFQGNGAGAAVTPQLEYIIPQQLTHKSLFLKSPLSYLIIYLLIQLYGSWN